MELLGGVLSGTGCVGRDRPLSNGVLLIALDVTRFLSMEEFHQEADDFVAHVKSSPTANGVDEILMPGEIEQQTQRQRATDGIVVEEETWQQIVEK